MHLPRALLAISATAACTLVAGHPGHDPEAELAAQQALLQRVGLQDLSHCAGRARTGQRRRALAARAVEKRGLQQNKGKNKGARDLSSLLRLSHHSAQPYRLNTDPAAIFALNHSSILIPETSEGPTYVSGEYIRKNITETQPGIPLTVDFQVLDTETCEPVTGAYLEIWQANATGAYSGVEYKGPRGIGGSSRSYATLGETWLRGAQLLDADGSAQFDTIFPGYYARRTTHIHLMVHTRETRAQANGTLLDNHASHVGQLYFDQELIDQVGAADVYRTNRENVTTNAHDRFLSSAVGAMSDPFMEYVLLGSKVEDGLLGWLSFGINTTLVREVHNAATHYAGGDKVNPPDPRLKHPPRSQKSVVAAARRS